jgi:hypothetical protein
MKIDSLNNINNTQQKNSAQNLNGNVSRLRNTDEGYKNISVNPNTNSNCYAPGSMSKLIDKILDFAKEIFRGQDLENIEKMLQQISDIFNMIDQILLFLIMKLVSLHKTDVGLAQNKNDNIIG